MAGVIKMVMAMKHGMVPPSLHVEKPTGMVDWSTGNVQLVTSPTPWPETGRPRRFGVSGFSASGTNAHVILEQAPVSKARTPVEHAVVPWVLSAKSLPALQAQAARLLSFVESNPGRSVTDIAYSLGTGRARFSHRAAVVGANQADFVRELSALASGDAQSAPVQRPPKVAFVFSGQDGSPELVHGLAEAFPVFATEVAAGFEVGLYRLLRSWGVRPSCLIGGNVAGESNVPVVSSVAEARDATLFVQLGPGPAGDAVALVQDDWTDVVTAVARLFVAGVPVDWAAYFAGTNASHVDLPTYAFQNRRYWLEPRVLLGVSPA
jgi:acyl transferase domain-containing protein